MEECPSKGALIMCMGDTGNIKFVAPLKVDFLDVNFHEPEDDVTIPFCHN